MSTPRHMAEQAVRRHRRKGFLLLTAGALILLAGVFIAWVVVHAGAHSGQAYNRPAPFSPAVLTGQVSLPP